jgi:hypothetical protein
MTPTSLASPEITTIAEPVPPNFRRRVIAFGASLAFLSFLDRAAISQAAPAIVHDLHLSPIQMGLVFSAFGLTYAACEIPSGWLCDRFGARRLLTRVVVLWSLFTAATGLAWNFQSLFVTRLLFGVGESGCFPSLARVFKTWLTPKQRNAAEGIKAASARWGAAITPALMTFLFAFLNWRAVFAVFGALGVLWAVVFWHLYTDKPTAEAQPKISWPKLFRSRSAWALGVQWFCHYYGFYFEKTASARCAGYRRRTRWVRIRIHEHAGPSGRQHRARVNRSASYCHRQPLEHCLLFICCDLCRRCALLECHRPHARTRSRSIVDRHTAPSPSGAITVGGSRSADLGGRCLWLLITKILKINSVWIQYLTGILVDLASLLSGYPPAQVHFHEPNKSSS